MLAQALFLWMFFAADPLERLAAAGAFGAYFRTRAAAFAFAADWRHGMAANSPLYMPGFFALAIAAWLWSEGARARDLPAFAAGLVAASAIAFAMAPLGSSRVIAAFHANTAPAATEPLLWPSASAMVSGTCTLLTWTAFVIGSRLALARRSLLPLLPVPLLTAGLIAVRPWTVDEFTTIWWKRAADGDVVALVSAAMIPAVAAWLVSHETTACKVRKEKEREGRKEEPNLF